MNFPVKVSREPTPITTSPNVIKIVDAAGASFPSLQKGFLDLYPCYSYRYSPLVQEFYLMMSSPGALDLSFLVTNESSPLAYCPLAIEALDGVVQGAYSKGGYLPIALFHPQLGDNQRKALERTVFDECVRRLSDHGATRWRIVAEGVSEDHQRFEDMFPSRFGALDVSIECHLMDLSLGKEDMWREIRHSSKSIINRGLKTYGFKVYDHSNFNPAVGVRHRLLHHKCSGRVTRPLETFEQMYSWVQDGTGLMFEQTFHGEVVQMIFVALGKFTACGASAADDPDFEWKVPLTHSMNFFIYEELRSRGFLYYEVGETPYRDTMFHMRSEKERKICDFKRGSAANRFL